MGVAEKIKNVFICKVCTLEERKGIIDALHTFHDVITWGYEDLKTYDMPIITHTIPLKPNVWPLWQR